MHLFRDGKNITIASDYLMFLYWDLEEKIVLFYNHSLPVPRIGYL